MPLIERQRTAVGRPMVILSPDCVDKIKVVLRYRAGCLQLELEEQRLKNDFIRSRSKPKSTRQVIALGQYFAAVVTHILRMFV